MIIKNKYIRLDEKFDMNVYCLWCILELFHYRAFPVKIKEKLDNLSSCVEENLFKPLPDGYDIVDEEFHVIRLLECFIPKGLDGNF